MFDTYYTKMFNAYDDDPTSENYEAWQMAEKLLRKFDSNPRKGNIVYAEYEDYSMMLDIIGGYFVRQDEIRFTKHY